MHSHQLEDPINPNDNGWHKLRGRTIRGFDEMASGDLFADKIACVKMEAHAQMYPKWKPGEDARKRERMQGAA